MNALTRWMQREGLTNADIAHALGITPSSSLRYGREGFWPSRVTAIRLLQLTRGEVMPNDFLEDAVTAARKEAQNAKTEKRSSARAAADRGKRPGARS